MATEIKAYVLVEDTQFVKKYELELLDNIVGVSFTREELEETYPYISGWHDSLYVPTGHEIMRFGGFNEIIYAGALANHVLDLFSKTTNKTVTVALPNFDSYWLNQLLRHYGLKYSNATGKFSKRAKPQLNHAVYTQAGRSKICRLLAEWIGVNYHLTGVDRINVGTKKDQNNYVVMCKKLGFKVQQYEVKLTHWLVIDRTAGDFESEKTAGLFDAVVHNMPAPVRAEVKKQLKAWWSTCKETIRE